jgi:hypothetical protein
MEVSFIFIFTQTSLKLGQSYGFFIDIDHVSTIKMSFVWNKVAEIQFKKHLYVSGTGVLIRLMCR